MLLEWGRKKGFANTGSNKRDGQKNSMSCIY